MGKTGHLGTKTRKTKKHLRKSVAPLTKRKRKNVLASMYKLKTLKSKKEFSVRKESDIIVKSLDIIDDTIKLIRINIDEYESLNMLNEKEKNDTIEYLSQFIPVLEKRAEDISDGTIRLLKPADVARAMKPVLDVAKHLFDLKAGSKMNENDDDLNDLIGRMKSVAVDDALDELGDLLGKLKMA